MISRVQQICDSYESGFGHGMAGDGLDLAHTQHSDAEMGEAYQIGYEAGRESRVVFSPDWLPVEHCRSHVRKWMRANAKNFKTATQLAEAAEDSLGFPPDFLDDESHWIWEEAFLAMEALYV